MASNIEIGVVEFNEREYKSVGVARQCLGVAVKRWGFPITVTKRGDKIYLIRRDM